MGISADVLASLKLKLIQTVSATTHCTMATIGEKVTI